MKLTLIRGLPGSGKTTYAKCLLYVNGRQNTLHYEADQWFEDADGMYHFDVNLLHKAHKWCQSAAEMGLKTQHNVIVSNTFTQIWEMRPYLDMAKYHNAQLQVIKCVGMYNNVHGVPEEVVKRMDERWEDYAGEIIHQ